MTYVGSIDVPPLELLNAMERAIDVELREDVNGNVL
jgi:hypothetical protein